MAAAGPPKNIKRISFIFANAAVDKKPTIVKLFLITKNIYNSEEIIQNLLYECFKK